MIVKFDRTISVGNLASMATIAISLFVLAAGLIATWTKMEGKVEATNMAVASMQQEAQSDLAKLKLESDNRAALREQQMNSQEVRIRSLEITMAGQSSDLRSIQNGIQEIKTRLMKMQETP